MPRVKRLQDGGLSTGNQFAKTKQKDVQNSENMQPFGTFNAFQIN